MSRKNQEIEYLRAVAVVITCLNHVALLFHWSPDPLAPLTQYFSFWGGVDLFFCISGYVVSRSFMSELDKAKTHGTQWRVAKAFWVRRAYRLIPSAWFWLGFSLLCTIFANTTGIFGTIAGAVKSSVAVLSMTANLSQYFGVPMHPNGVYWSLALEEQFYLLFPFFILIVPIKWRWKILLFAIAAQFPIARAYATDFSWFVRVDALMWGVLIAIFSKTKEYKTFEPQSLGNRSAATIFSCSLLIALGVLPALLGGVPFHVGLMAIAAALLVFAASFDRGYVLPVGIMQPVLLWTGSRSYAIYLCHLPAFMLTHEIWTRWTNAKGMQLPNGTYTIRYAITAIVLIGLFAELNYRLIESPLRRRGSIIATAIANPT